MKFNPINEEEEATKWVEIPNTAAHGIRVTEDDGEAVDPFADQAGDAAPADDAGGDASADAPATTDADAAAEPAPEAPAEEAPAEEAPAETIDDPKAKMRELLAYYTNYMNELVQDPNTSTDLISATQEMIDSLIKNMESADGIEEVKAEAEEAAKEEVSAEEAPPEETPAEETPAEEPVSETQENPITDIPVQEEQKNPITDIPVQENVDDEQAAIDAKIDSEVDDLHKDDWENIEPATSDNILTPGDIANSPVNDVDLSAVPPTPDEELAATAPDMAAPAPTSDVLDDTALPTPDEEDALFG